jgi:hypothetical protein
MSSQTKIIAIIGGILIIAAGAFYFYESKAPPAPQATQRGFHP